MKKEQRRRRSLLAQLAEHKEKCCEKKVPSGVYKDSVLAVNDALAELGIDKALPPGSDERTFFDAELKNLASAATRGNNKGARYNPALYDYALQTLGALGNVKYDALRKKHRALPSRRSVSDIKNFVGADEEGVLEGVMESLMHTNLKDRRLWLDAQAKKGSVQQGAAGADAEDLLMRWGWAMSFDSMKFHKKGAYSRNYMYMSGNPTGLEHRNLVAAEFRREIARQAAHTARHVGGEAAPAPKANDGHTATEYMVVFLSSLGSERVCLPVARYFFASVDAESILELVDEVLCATAVCGLRVVVISCDGAQENRAAATVLCTHSAKEFLPADFRAKFPNVDWNHKLGQDHPSMAGLVVLWVFDMVHAMKKVRDALDSSSGRAGREHDAATGLLKVPKGARFMLVAVGPLTGDEAPEPTGLSVVGPKFEALTLGKVRDAVYRPVGHAISATHLTEDHFHLSALPKMRFCLAAQVLSQRTLTLLDASGKAGLGGYKQLLRHVDCIVDVGNCSRDKHPSLHGCAIQPVSDTADPQLVKLVEALDCTSRWKASLEGLPADHRASSFLPGETWNELQGICLGMPALVFLHCKAGSNKQIVFRRVSQDPDENHFANVKGFNRGSGSTVDVAGVKRGNSHGCAAGLAQSTKANVTAGTSATTQGVRLHPTQARLERSRLKHGAEQRGAAQFFFIVDDHDAAL